MVSETQLATAGIRDTSELGKTVDIPYTYNLSVAGRNEMSHGSIWPFNTFYGKDSSDDKDMDMELRLEGMVKVGDEWLDEDQLPEGIRKLHQGMRRTAGDGRKKTAVDGRKKTTSDGKKKTASDERKKAAGDKRKKQLVMEG